MLQINIDFVHEKTLALSPGLSLIIKISFCWEKCAMHAALHIGSHALKWLKDDSQWVLK